MGTLNSRVQLVQTPIAGVALSHLRTVPTENLISAKKVKEGSCGKRITRFEVRDCFACRENSNVSASRA